MAPLSGSSNLTGRPTINEGFISSIEHPRGDHMQGGGVRNKHGQLGVEPTLAAGRGPFCLARLKGLDLEAGNTGTNHLLATAA